MLVEGQNYVKRLGSLTEVIKHYSLMKLGQTGRNL